MDKNDEGFRSIFFMTIYHFLAGLEEIYASSILVPQIVSFTRCRLVQRRRFSSFTAVEVPCSFPYGLDVSHTKSYDCLGEFCLHVFWGDILKWKEMFLGFARKVSHAFV